MQPKTVVQPDTVAIVVAGGAGLRFGAPQGKLYISLLDKPILSWAIKAMIEAPCTAQVVVVIAKNKFDFVENTVLASLDLTEEQRQRIVLCEGGNTRQESVMAGLREADRSYPFIAIHDGARPLFTAEGFRRAKEYLSRINQIGPEPISGVVVGHKTTDTLKQVEGCTIVGTPNRSSLWAAETPQIFVAQDILKAYQRGQIDGVLATDDSSLVERLGMKVELFDAGIPNIKVTLPTDLVVARALMHSVAGKGESR